MTASTGRRARRSRAQWQSLIERGERSALSIGAFCAGEGVSTASYYTWRKRLGRSAAAAVPVVSGGLSDTGPAFVDLGALGARASAPGGWEIELALGEGVVLRLRRG